MSKTLRVLFAPILGAILTGCATTGTFTDEFTFKNDVLFIKGGQLFKATVNASGSVNENHLYGGTGADCKFAQASGVTCSVQAAAWSPDGSMIAMIATHQAGDSGKAVFIAKSDMSKSKLIGTTVLKFGSQPNSISWSPNGRVIAFAGTDTETFDLCTSDRNTLPDTSYPVWVPFPTRTNNPSGKLDLIYSSKNANGHWDLYLGDSTHPTSKILLPVNDSDSDDYMPITTKPGVKKTGQFLAFSSNRGGTHQIYRTEFGKIIGTGSSSLKQISSGTGDTIWPEIAPLGLFIAYDEGAEIHRVVSTNGSNQQSIATGDGPISWRQTRDPLLNCDNGRSVKSNFLN